MGHKSGFVNIIGNPNVGKSTLMNAIMGEKMSIITSKAQTTRHRIMGIYNDDNVQIVFSDTPGIIQPKYKLQESMMRFVGTALVDADVIIYVTDVVETSDKNEAYIEKIKNSKVPVFVIINKIDLSNQQEVEELVEKWKSMVPNAEIMPISAINNINVNFIFNRILELLPEGPAFYPKNQFTDKPERFFVTEFIREKIFLNYKKEIPYSCEVVVEEFKEDDDIIRINAVIYVERDSQKGIIIGQKGAAIKKVGTDARKDMEEFFGKKIFLELFVKVSKDWKNKINDLKRFGYYQ